MKTLGSYFCVSCLGSLSHTHRCSGESLSEEATSQSHARVLRPDTMTHWYSPPTPTVCVCVCVSEWVRGMGGAVTIRAEVKKERIKVENLWERERHRCSTPPTSRRCAARRTVKLAGQHRDSSVPSVHTHIRALATRRDCSIWRFLSCGRFSHTRIQLRTHNYSLLWPSRTDARSLTHRRTFESIVHIPIRPLGVSREATGMYKAFRSLFGSPSDIKHAVHCYRPSTDA